MFMVSELSMTMLWYVFVHQGLPDYVLGVGNVRADVMGCRLSVVLRLHCEMGDCCCLGRPAFLRGPPCVFVFRGNDVWLC